MRAPNPVGTILGPGSTDLRLAPREEQVATMVAMGYTYKKIGHRLGIATHNVGDVVSKIAARIPGEGLPRTRVTAWVWVYGTEYFGRSP